MSLCGYGSDDDGAGREGTTNTTEQVGSSVPTLKVELALRECEKAQERVQKAEGKVRSAEKEHGDEAQRDFKTAEWKANARAFEAMVQASEEERKQAEKRVQIAKKELSDAETSRENDVCALADARGKLRQLSLNWEMAPGEGPKAMYECLLEVVEEGSLGDLSCLSRPLSKFRKLLQQEEQAEEQFRKQCEDLEGPLKREADLPNKPSDIRDIYSKYQRQIATSQEQSVMIRTRIDKVRRDLERKTSAAAEAVRKAFERLASAFEFEGLPEGVPLEEVRQEVQEMMELPAWPVHLKETPDITGGGAAGAQSAPPPAALGTADGQFSGSGVNRVRGMDNATRALGQSVDGGSDDSLYDDAVGEAYTRDKEDGAAWPGRPHSGLQTSVHHASTAVRDKAGRPHPQAMEEEASQAAEGAGSSQPLKRKADEDACRQSAQKRQVPDEPQPEQTPLTPGVVEHNAATDAAPVPQQHIHDMGAVVHSEETDHIIGGTALGPLSSQAALDPAAP